MTPPPDFDPDQDVGSRIPAFYQRSISSRRQVVGERTGIELGRFEREIDGGLDAAVADKIVENVVGLYALPFGVALNFRVNHRDRLVPMVIEEPSVIAAASNAAKMVRSAGGFTAEMVESLMTAQVQLSDVPDASRALRELEAHREELLSIAAAVVPGLTERGGGPRGLDVRDLGSGWMVVHVHVDCRDAMGANMVNTVAEAIGPRAAELSSGRLGLRILSNLCDRRRVRVTCRAHAPDLAVVRVGAEVSGSDVIDGIVGASRFAELDPYRAATHNKGILNGVDAVVMATGNDWRAVEAGAHAYAARSGQYSPLAIWRRDGADLVGELEMPLALGIVGGTLRVHPTARLALDILEATSAAELCEVAAAAGLASNLAALRALATEGIQRGHMSLHARSVAIAAGATGDEVEHVAHFMSEAGQVSLEMARGELSRKRAELG